MVVGQPQLMKEVNSDILQKLIDKNGPISKPELARATKLSLPTVNKIVDLLEEDGLICQQGTVGQGAGRKAKLYIANGSAGSIAVLYFLSGRFVCCLADLSGSVMHQCEVPVDPSTRESALESLFAAADMLFALPGPAVKALGVGVPGAVLADGSLAAIPAIPEWEGLRLGELLRARYPSPVFVENDVKLSTIGYYHENLSEKMDTMIYFYVGDCLGAGVIMDGKLLKGASCFAGELGYMALDSGEAPCSDNAPDNAAAPRRWDHCGGWLETRLSGETDGGLRLKLVARAVVNCAVVLGPDAVVLRGGGITPESLPLLEAEARRYIPAGGLPRLICSLSDTDGLGGAIRMCLSGIRKSTRLVEESGVYSNGTKNQR